MNRLLRILLPTRISSQIALIIVAGLVIIHAVVTAIFFLYRPDDHGRPESPAQLTTLVRLIDAAPPADRPRILAEVARSFPQMELGPLDPSPTDVAWLDRDVPPLGLLARRLGNGFRVAALESDPGEGAAHRVAIQLKDGQVIAARIVVPPPPPFGPGSVTLLSLAVIIALLGLWAARMLTAPLRAFAAAAEAFRPDGEISPLPERGPAEIKTAAKALNQMRERIKRLVDDRTRMLAALGHDLRTPITRLRLRSEFIGDEGLRRQMLDDLDQMTAMVESVLVFLRKERSHKDTIAIYASASLQTICDQFVDLGHDVRYDGPDHAAIKAHRSELHRALTNVIDNAVRYGGRAIVRMQADPAGIVITVEDEGPGIPGAEQKAAMLEPFVRGEAARSMDDKTGFGLGLSIAHAIVAAHGGTLTLLDREPSGLAVRIALPSGEAASPRS
jgi:signal transduction histidine kinase